MEYYAPWQRAVATPPSEPAPPPEQPAMARYNHHFSMSADPGQSVRDPLWPADGPAPGGAAERWAVPEGSCGGWRPSPTPVASPPIGAPRQVPGGFAPWAPRGAPAGVAHSRVVPPSGEPRVPPDGPPQRYEQHYAQCYRQVLMPSRRQMPLGDISGAAQAARPTGWGSPPIWRCHQCGYQNYYYRKVCRRCLIVSSGEPQMQPHTTVARPAEMPFQPHYSAVSAQSAKPYHHQQQQCQEQQWGAGEPSVHWADAESRPDGFPGDIPHAQRSVVPEIQEHFIESDRQVPPPLGEVPVPLHRQPRDERSQCMFRLVKDASGPQAYLDSVPMDGPVGDYVQSAPVAVLDLSAPCAGNCPIEPRTPLSSTQPRCGSDSTSFQVSPHAARHLEPPG
eukprot:TRINITY_DN20835_c0_g1_i1.p1 TRINITY_DN20835_c0_g1~~TRINITY_DN20835_c0_g1_i1.p1  ORF type:complete len:392 (+),score=62.08 TRINITY_DN20835_c0_g1_i1:180-1355(+)